MFKNLAMLGAVVVFRTRCGRAYLATFIICTSCIRLLMPTLHGWRIFGMYLLSILMFFVGLCLLIVGALFALMWSGCAFASLYHAVDLEDQARLNQNGAS